MREKNLWRGELVRLAAIEPERDAAVMGKWTHDSEYTRLRDSNPARPRLAASVRERLVDDGERPVGALHLGIRTLAGDQLIGTILLDSIRWNHAYGWLGIGIGEREYWGRGYGTEAVRIGLHYAFTELNLWRVALSVLATNVRALRAYEKAGFVIEGRVRGLAHIDGERYDEVFMGVLRREWESGQAGREAG